MQTGADSRGGMDFWEAESCAWIILVVIVNLNFKISISSWKLSASNEDQKVIARQNDEPTLVQLSTSIRSFSDNEI